MERLRHSGEREQQIGQRTKTFRCFETFEELLLAVHLRKRLQFFFALSS
jgi:hypothetical protein